MNKLILAITVVIIVGIGGYLFINGQKGSSMSGQGHNAGSTSEKPVAKPGGRYQLEVTSDITNIQPKQPTKFRFWVKDSSGDVFKKYEIAHEKLMHLIGVRKDLTNFLHLHPEYNEATGEFTVDIPFPEDGQYRLFPDFTPSVDNPDKQPVTLFTDIMVGNLSNYKPQSLVPDTEKKKTFGEYEVSFDLPKDLQKGGEFTYGVTIEKDGTPVTNLETYLGALGHSVILKEGTLTFIHTHALSSSSQDSTIGGHAMQDSQADTKKQGPKIEFSTTFPKAGVYKIFTQFQHQGKIMTIDYTVEVKK